MWYSPDNFFDLDQLKGSPVEPLFQNLTYVWETLDDLEPFIKKIVKGNVSELRQNGDMLSQAAAICEGKIYREVEYQLGDPFKNKLKVRYKGQLLPGAALIMPGVIICDNEIEIGEGALVESGALLKGPSIIGPRSEVRQGAYVRGSVMSSPGSVIGHVTEVKNTLLLESAKAGHFAYLGDSILGRNVNLGAGTKLANLKMNDNPYSFRFEGEKIRCDRRKFGAIIGDDTETGCNTVTNPGTLLGKLTKVMPNSSVAPGYRPGGSYLNR